MNQLAYPRLVTTSLSQPGRVLQSDQEHHRVLELIVAKDGDSAERVMREHVRASRRALHGRPRRLPRWRCTATGPHEGRPRCGLRLRHRLPWSEHFTGTAWMDLLLQEPLAPVEGDVSMASVTFAPGVRTHWHRHEGGQMLLVVAGRGLGRQPRRCPSGGAGWGTSSGLRLARTTGTAPPIPRRSPTSVSPSGQPTGTPRPSTCSPEPASRSQPSSNTPRRKVRHAFRRHRAASTSRPSNPRSGVLHRRRLMDADGRDLRGRRPRHRHRHRRGQQRHDHGRRRSPPSTRHTTPSALAPHWLRASGRRSSAAPTSSMLARHRPAGHPDHGRERQGRGATRAAR